MNPRLTIAIPHLDRTDFLRRAIDSVLRQTEPAICLVADQGGTEETRLLMESYRDHPLVRHVPTDAGGLWPNWLAAMDAADTEYFAWLQDDDVVSRRYANRVRRAFEAFPAARTWTAPLACAHDEHTGFHFVFNGPLWPMDLLDFIPNAIDGGLLVPIAYVTSWALSPGVAFRNTDAFRAAMHGLPGGCDLFYERMVLAAMGAQGPVVCDPYRAGYWIHHGRNESYRQQEETRRQQDIALPHVERLMDRVPNWELLLDEWCRIMPPSHLINYAESLSDKSIAESGSVYGPRIRDLIRRSLDEHHAIPSKAEEIEDPLQQQDDRDHNQQDGRNQGSRPQDG